MTVLTGATPTRRHEARACAGLCTEAGFAAAYGAHSPRLLRTARAVLGDPDLAQDAVQETFLRAWRACARFDPTGPPLIGWLVTITRNVAIDQLRARAVRTAVPGEQVRCDPRGNRSHERRPRAFPWHESAVRTVTPGPMDGVVLRSVLVDALARVSDRHREVLVRAVVQDRTHADVAAEVGVPVGTVKSRLHHGLRGMRTLLDRWDQPAPAFGAATGNRHRSREQPFADRR